MRPARKAIRVLAVAASLSAATAGAQPSASPATAGEKLSYAIALEVARRFADQGLALDEAMALQGIRDGASGTSALPEDELRRLLNSLQSEARRRNASDRRIALLKNQRDGEAALAAVDRQAGTLHLADGIRYRVVEPGRNTAPPVAPRERLRFVARTLDGREVARVGDTEAATLNPETLIPGLRKALARMPTGARWTLWIPPEQAYGPSGNGAIGPNQTLVFEVERLGEPLL